LGVAYEYYLLYTSRKKIGAVVKNQQGLQGAGRLLLIQIGITLLAALIALSISGAHAAISVVLGGLVSALPSAYFARTLFRHKGARSARLIVSRFYKGEAIKISLSVVLFALVFRFANVIPSIFFAAYVVVQLVMWFAPLIFVNKQNRPDGD